MIFDTFKEMHEKEIARILSEKDKDGLIELLKSAHEEGYSSGWINGYNDGLNLTKGWDWR